MGEDKDCTAVAVRPQAQGQLILGSLNDFLAFGKIMVDSGMFPDVKTTAQAVVKMQAGAELGLPPLYSLQHVSITSQGKLTIDAAIMANLIKRSGTYDYQILEHSGERCSIQMLQNGQKLGQPVVFTLDDARRAGLADKDVWKKYPKNLLFARTISNAARWYCPHVIGNAYTPEEMSSAVGVQVQVLDEPPEAPRAQTDAPKPTAAPAPFVSDERQRLITDYQAAARAAVHRGMDEKQAKVKPDISNADLKTFTAHLEAFARDFDGAAKAKAEYEAAEAKKLADAERELSGTKAEAGHVMAGMGD